MEGRERRSEKSRGEFLGYRHVEADSDRNRTRLIDEGGGKVERAVVVRLNSFGGLREANIK